MLKIAILISGRGSNMQALIDAARQPNCLFEIVGIISNKSEAGGVELAKAANLPVHIIHHRDFSTREAFDQALHAKLSAVGAQLLCLAGFMRLLSSWFVDRWRDRLINIHPSLLPAFPGLDTHKKALAYGVQVTGCTIYFVRAEMDHGPIIVQAAVPVFPGDNEERLAARVLAAEHVIYPEAVRWIAENRVNVSDEKVFIAGVEASGGFYAPYDRNALAKSLLGP